MVGKDYYIYREKLEDCSNRELIDRSEEIASVMAAYRYLTGENSLTAEEIDYLLRFDRPLVEVVKYCPAADTNACIAVEYRVNLYASFLFSGLRIAPNTLKQQV